MKRLNKKRILSLVGTLVMVTTILAMAGLLRWYWSADINLSSGPSIYVDDTRALESIHVMDGVVYPGETIVYPHSIRLDPGYPLSFVDVDFLIWVNMSGVPISDNELVVSILEEGIGDPITSMRVYPNLESSAQSFTIQVVADSMIPDDSYTVQVKIVHKSIGY